MSCIPRAVIWLAAAGLTCGTLAQAQNAPIQATPLPPLQQQWQKDGSPPVQQGPVASPGQGTDTGQPADTRQGPDILQPGSAGQGPDILQPANTRKGPDILQPENTAKGTDILQPGNTAPGTDAGQPAGTGQAAPAPGVQGQDRALPAIPPVAPPATVEQPNIWVPESVVKLQALDKVNAQIANLTIKVGQSATFKSLTIALKSCMVRPSDQPADAAAYLDVTDSRPDSPAFNGWMLQDEPSVSMMQHPIYDLRVIGCT